MAELAFGEVHKAYGDVAALRGFDLTVADGELLVLVGPSGCGKTTALRVAAGLESVSSGTVRIGRRDVTGLAPADRNVSMVFQGYALFPHMTAAENIGFGLHARRVGRDEIVRRVAAAAEAVGCADLLGRRPWQLSGGERQRVALARALVREPDVFLLDEPLSNLDAHLRGRMRTELRRLHDRVGATMVHVTHDQVEALTMGDRVAVLADGVVQQVGDPDEIYRRPANRFVATFIGSPQMNVLPAEAVEGGLRAGPFLVQPAVPVEGRPVEVGIRPEDLVVGPPDAGAGAQVVAVEVAGSEAYLVLDAGGLELIARSAAVDRPAVGARVGLSVSNERVHVFDAETGAAMRLP